MLAPDAGAARPVSWRRMSDLVRVALVENEPSAELAVGLLRTEGIPAMWRETSLGLTNWGAGSIAGVMGPMEILVHPEHAERAHELLAEDD